MLDGADFTKYRRFAEKDRSRSCESSVRRRLIAPALAALCLLLGSPVHALETQYAAIIADAASGRVLYEYNADLTAHPASLAKMMTLYLAFEALQAGNLLPTDELKISARAARQPPSRLGLKKGATISARTAILALVTKSANDVAAALAEQLAGSEPEFAQRMNAKARDLGMKYTRFRNASGLHDPDQITTARDMMVLAHAVLRDFPEESRYFSVREFEYGGRVYTNHNGLLGTYAGTDGIKTGYIRAAGYNLAASVHREGRHLLGIVLGGQSAAVRDLNMIYLFERAFARLRVEQSGGVLTQAAVMGPTPADGQFELAALPAGLAGYISGMGLEGWGVQVGAYSSPSSAAESTKRAANLVPDLLEPATLSVVRVTTEGQTLHRARAIGMTYGQALQACARLLAFSVACMPVEPGGGIKGFN